MKIYCGLFSFTLVLRQNLIVYLTLSLNLESSGRAFQGPRLQGVLQAQLLLFFTFL